MTTEQFGELNLAQEQAKDPDIQEVLRWKEANIVPSLRYANTTLRKYAKHFAQLVVTDGVLYREFFDAVGAVQADQFCVPKHLWKEIIYRLHNSATAGHLGIVNTIHEFRKRFYYPSFTEHYADFIKNCLTCLQLKRIPEKQIRPPLESLTTQHSFPGDMFQADLVGPFPSDVYKFVLTGVDVFTKYLFAVPLTNTSADTVARELVRFFFHHCYIPRTIVTDLGTNFTSELMKELATLLQMNLKHASLKHPQTIGVVERSHAMLNRILKCNTDEHWSDWHKYVPLTTFIHNTSYHSAIGCSPSTLFHGREPIKPLDLRFSRKALEAVEAGSDFVQELQDAMLRKFALTQRKLIESYHLSSVSLLLRSQSHCETACLAPILYAFES